VLDQNPQLRAMLNDPGMLQQAMKAMQDPAMIKQAMEQGLRESGSGAADDGPVQGGENVVEATWVDKESGEQQGGPTKVYAQKKPKPGAAAAGGAGGQQMEQTFARAKEIADEVAGLSLDEAKGRLDQALSSAMAAQRGKGELPPPGEGMEQYYQGTGLAEAGQLEQAALYFAECVKLSPAFAPARAQLAQILIGQRKWAEAEAQLREGLELVPGFAPARLQLGQVLVEQAQYGEAETHLVQAIEGLPLWGETFRAGAAAEAGADTAVLQATAHRYMGLVCARAGRDGSAEQVATHVTLTVLTF
jgi:tetratricopeptide (TPR) repeat protein